MDDVSRWRVAVSVLAFHSADTVLAAVRSALDQSHPGPVDVVVREQGGDDDEYALLAELERSWVADASGPPRSLRIERGDNLGFAGGHNRLVGATTGEVVVVLNADARLAPDLVERALPALVSAPDVGAVQPLVLRSDGSVDAAGLEIMRSRRAAARGQGAAFDPAAMPAGEVFGPDGAVSVLRREALDDVAVPTGDGVAEVYAAAFVAYFEDVDLAWRLRWRGWRTLYEPSAVAWHDRSARDRPGEGAVARARARRAMPPTARRLGWANDRLVRVRVEPLRGLLADLPWILGRETLSWVLLLARPRDIGPSLRQLLRGIRPAWRARRWILGHRRAGADPYVWVRR